MTGNGWLFESCPTHLQAINTDWWWHFSFAGGTGKKKNNCRSVFHICKLWVLMSQRLFCQQWRVHMVPEFHTLARHMERQPLSIAVVCLLWRGVTSGPWCVHTCVGDCMHVLVVMLVSFCLFGFFFFPCVTAYCLISGHSPPSTWCLPLCEWLMCLSWWSQWDKTERGMGQVCERQRRWGGGCTQRRHDDYIERSPFVFYLMLLEARYSWFKMPPWLADQEWKIAAVDKLTSSGLAFRHALTLVHEQAAQCGQTPELFVSFLSWLHWDFEERASSSFWNCLAII